MTPAQSNIIVIGGGLTGLLLTYLLQQANQDVLLIEARDRLGGRIWTHYEDQQAPVEMGATWLGKKHTALVALLEELGIGIFEQVLGDRAIYHPISTSPPQLVQLPPNDEPSYRIQGGSSKLIEALVEQIDSSRTFTGSHVKRIVKEGDQFSIQTETQTFQASIVVSTLPPHLLTSTIDVQPTLPEALLSISNQTHTWMGESIKVSLTYPKPFWRSANLSGTIFSNVGPIPEMYDHSNVEDNRYALKGFMNGNYFSLSKEERLALILDQLQTYFGTIVHDYLSYDELVWRKEPYTFSPYESHVLPHQHNGHPIYQEAFFDGTFFIGGSETATQFPGYMDGAVRSARGIFEKIVT